jgi:NAD+ diphosphatase
MRFVPSIQPTSAEKEAALWFVFCGDKLLVRTEDEIATTPYIADLESSGLNPIRKVYLGTLDGRPCYSAALADDASAPENMAFLGLRQLFGLIEEDLLWVAGHANQIMNWDQAHRYCGRCGTLTEDKPDERAKICPKCGLMNYPRISPAIIVAVIKNNRILLARAHRFPIELYSVIAGFVEPGECLEECLRREVREEVSIEVKNLSYFGSQPWPFPNSLMVAFIADYADGEISVDETEIVDAGWFTAHNLPRIPDRVSIARQLIDWFVEKYK